MCSRNRDRESSQIYFFCGGHPYYEVVRRSKNTHEELTGRLERLADLSLPLSDQWISTFSSKLQNYWPYIVFSSPIQIYDYPLLPLIFLFMAGYWNLHTSGFFQVIYWSFLRTETSVTLFIGNKLYSRHHLLYLSFLRKLLCWCYLATALNLLSLSTARCR